MIFKYLFNAPYSVKPIVVGAIHSQTTVRVFRATHSNHGIEMAHHESTNQKSRNQISMNMNREATCFVC
jgi:hypothetical protein